MACVVVAVGVVSDLGQSEGATHPLLDCSMPSGQKQPTMQTLMQGPGLGDSQVGGQAVPQSLNIMPSAQVCWVGVGGATVVVEVGGATVVTEIKEQ